MHVETIHRELFLNLDEGQISSGIGVHLTPMQKMENKQSACKETGARIEMIALCAHIAEAKKLVI